MVQTLQFGKANKKPIERIAMQKHEAGKVSILTALGRLAAVWVLAVWVPFAQAEVTAVDE